MLNYQEENQLNSFKKAIQIIWVAFKNLINPNDNDDDSPNKAQLLAQRVDGKKVPVNRKF
ncbi:hypothetical protein [Cellulophaga sp. Hel_I_12]|uniref:hypothetical protein n=1 Tax=Cellulophaga sp. Hel_I_12 TaxID=1249972 RepID=UPI00064790F6|nr:hypothetical protein [Cellulophaga sp. Hel_I_12]